VDASDRSLRIPDIDQARYMDLDEGALGPLWRDVESAAGTVTQQVEKAVADERSRQLQSIAEAGGGSPEERMRRWQRRLREYQVARDDVLRTPLVPLARPYDLERRAIRGWGRRGAETRLHEGHLEYLGTHARNERRRQLEALLDDMIERVGRRVDTLSRLASQPGAADAAAELGRRAEGSAAWRGRLDEPHPFQFHALDLDALGRTAGANPAVGRLYEWATQRIGASLTDGRLDYSPFLGSVASHADIERVAPGGDQLTESVVGYFSEKYLKVLQGENLLDLLDRTAPEERGRPDADRPADRALSELLTRLMTLRTDLVAFDAHIGGDETMEALQTEIFLGCHVRNKGQETRIREVASQAGILSPGVDHFRRSLDEHRLQVLYMHHGISLSTIYDFFSPVNSAMERYRHQEKTWSTKPTAGGLPPHSCTALRDLVRELKVVESLLRSSNDGSANGSAGSGRGLPML